MKITTLSISLLVGFFCFHASAGCLTLGGTIVPVLELGTFCPARETVQFVDTDGDKCIIQATSDWICAVDSYGKAFGGPYRYTGFTLNEPETPPPEQQPPVNVEVPDNPTSPPLQLSGDFAVATNAIITSVNNANKNLSDFSKKMSAAMSLTAQKDEEIRNQTIRTYNQTVTNFNQLNAVQGALNEINNQAVTDARLATERNTENRDLHKQTRDKIQELQDDTDLIMEEIPKLEAISSTLGGIVDGVGALQSLASQAETRDYEISNYTQNTMNNLAQRMVDYRQQSYYEYNDLVSRITSLSGGGPDQPCGISLGDPPCPPEGGDGFTAIDSQNLQTIASASQEISSAVRSLGYGLDDVELAVKNVDDSVENVEDAVDSMRSALSDDLYYTSAQLGEKLDGINSTLQGGIGGGPSGGDTVTHEKLDGISDTLGSIADSLSGTIPDGSASADSLALPDYQQKLDDGYTQIMEKVNGQVEGMEKITGITNELKSYSSLPDFFRLAQSSCQPIDFGSKSMDLCAYTPTIRTVLTWVFYMLTALFMIKSFHQTIQNMRL